MTGFEPSGNKRHRSRPACWDRLDAKIRRLLECLQDADAEALECKRRLGQYAVWRDGRPRSLVPTRQRYPRNHPHLMVLARMATLLDVGCSGLDFAATTRKPLIC